MTKQWTACIAAAFFAAISIAAGDFEAGARAYDKGDFATALKEWMPVAEKGGSAAQFNIGLLYQEGQGVPQNYTEAAKWFERSADQGYLKAEHNLGAMYASGRGVKRDYVQAYKWMSLCAAGGDGGCASQRDQIAQKLSAGKLAKAQQLASEWKPAAAQQNQ